LAFYYRNPIIPWILSVIIIVLLTFDYFVPNTGLTPAVSEITAWASIAVAFAAWVGLINVVLRSVRDIRKRRPGRWYFGIYELFLIIVVLASGFGEGKWASGSIISWVLANAIRPASLAVVALLGFWSVRAMYRTFKLHTIESAMFILGGVLVMLLNVPLGSLIWPGFTPVGIWVYQVAYKGTWTGLTIALGVGAVAYIVRYLMGRETGALGAPREAQ